MKVYTDINNVEDVKKYFGTIVYDAAKNDFENDESLDLKVFDNLHYTLQFEYCSAYCIRTTQKHLPKINNIQEVIKEQKDIVIGQILSVLETGDFAKWYNHGNFNKYITGEYPFDNSYIGSIDKCKEKIYSDVERLFAEMFK